MEHKQTEVLQAIIRRGALGLEHRRHLPMMDSLAGPVVWDGPIQRDPVAEVRVVAVLLSQVFSIALLRRRQSGRKAAFTSTPEALDQTQRLGQTCVRYQTKKVQLTS